MKKIFLLAAFLHGILLHAQTSAPWLKQVSFLGAEDIKTMGYVPGNATANASIWLFAQGDESPGSGTVFQETRFSGRKAADGALIFDHLVEGLTINKITYDPSLDQVLVLINLDESSSAMPAIGPNTFPVSSCYTIGLLRYNRSGLLLATQWLPFPCTHDLASAPNWDIDTLQERVALSMSVYGDPDEDSTLFTFGPDSMTLRTDSTYTGIFQWDYSGTPLQLSMFQQPDSLALRSHITDIVYGNNGDICLLGQLKSDIHLGGFSLLHTPGGSVSFAIRLRQDGTVAAAKKVFSSSATFSAPVSMIYSPANKHFYFAHSWSDQLVTNGSTVERGNVGFYANLLVAEIDSSLIQQHVITVRHGDTVGTNHGSLYSFKCLQPDAAGNVVLGFSVNDSFRFGNKLFRSSVSNNQTDVAIIRCDKDLRADTCIRSAGTGIEQISVLATGPGDEVYIGGHFMGQLVFPPLEADVTDPGLDAFVVKLNLKKSVTGIRPPATSATWSLYPNPASDKLCIELENIRSIALYTIDGRIIKTKAFDGNSDRQKIDVSDLQPGVYIIRVMGQKGDSGSASFTKK